MPPTTVIDTSQIDLLEQVVKLVKGTDPAKKDQRKAVRKGQIVLLYAAWQTFLVEYWFELLERTTTGDTPKTRSRKKWTAFVQAAAIVKRAQVTNISPAAPAVGTVGVLSAETSSVSTLEPLMRDAIFEHLSTPSVGNAQKLFKIFGIDIAHACRTAVMPANIAQLADNKNNKVQSSAVQYLSTMLKLRHQIAHRGKGGAEAANRKVKVGATTTKMYCDALEAIRAVLP
mmetsp:Transcript_6372/g.11050  ORF Transcript_6372/g.11050 Transcript_6372/m.11050 type:complete len:229 (+) Transcript_6372:79-765(+)|eukprot:CAMPEP_0168583456 /NCGR_PEP_ID=MMETSP0420-20121227/2571_1 /TAXON_ID=498008 /ORGANISM="Pessonella sp." /LENGTH=228 /DNA_ID=CAMNT_0008618103 /DNA_START=53 /DNA_END=739 /DNA_ORIENTATION=+